MPPPTDSAVLQPTATPPRRSRLAFVGAGALVAVGYMDPGNWATAIAGGAKYGYSLLIVIAVASVMAMLLQWIAARVGVVTGRDLAQLCRDRFPRPVTVALWVASEIAIIACDVAEIVGSAVALQLLFHVKLWVGVLIAAVVTILMLAVQRYGQRTMESMVASLILLVALCFVAQLAMAQPEWAAVLGGMAPSSQLVRDAGMLWLAAGIVGATVMPHNLFLHSSLVRRFTPPPGGRRERRRSLAEILSGMNLDTFGSLSFAFLINAALLILAASVFHANGLTDVEDLADAHRLLAPLLHSDMASLLFAVALLACGLNSTLTGTLAGQAVMEGFLNLKMSRMRRALLTRAVAIVPALLAVSAFGEHGSASLLVASQVVLSLTLPLAVVPLIWFGSSRDLMGAWRVRGLPLMAAWGCAAVILFLNGALLWQGAVS
ncbi:Nramp family divalent metal transporter [Cupriavidus sp. SW-Y-13]|uniref:Nramp family divalent metal transporter n=1 Tax=Cupriavidus sp. SW-Y-13 TaxID=2653854 RepID=UPI00136534EA|nr:Nramp family divalent metal transporter [Cupriavidus sp. SW-Y-13]MWL87408.1 Mn(2+) uptake NRAMP transporter MntH [Cupriavidus sp. SW-Y-13]